MPTREYRFETRWRVYGTAEEVFDVLSDPSQLPRWWPSVYLAVEEMDPPSADGSGRRVALLTRGWLPYQLGWILRTLGGTATCPLAPVGGPSALVGV